MQCRIPFPNQSNKEDIINWISECVQIINTTLISNQTDEEYIYEYPTLSNLLTERRLDAAIYCKEYAENIRLVEAFKGGYWKPSEYGFSVIPGPSLEIKLLKTRIDSDTYKKGFYQLLLPSI